MEESGDDEGADDPMSVDVDGDSNTEQSLLDHEDGDVGVGVGVGIGNITEWPSISRQYDLDEMDVSYGLHDARGGEGTPGDGGFDYMDPTEAEIGPFGLATLPALSRRAKARGTPINREVPAAFKIGDADRRGDEDEQSDENEGWDSDGRGDCDEVDEDGEEYGAEDSDNKTEDGDQADGSGYEGDGLGAGKAITDLHLLIPGLRAQQPKYHKRQTSQRKGHLIRSDQDEDTPDSNFDSMEETEHSDDTTPSSDSERIAQLASIPSEGRRGSLRDRGRSRGRGRGRGTKVIDQPADIQNESFEASAGNSEQVEGNIQGGRARGRGRGRGRGRAVKGRRGWRAVLDRMKPSEDASEVDSGTTSRLNPGVSSPTRASKSSRGGGVQRGRRRGYRSLAQPSIEFKRLQGEATQAFVIDGDLEAALNAARRAVQINPEIFAAHSLLSEILLSMGRKEDSVGALFSGAHTKRDPKMWWLVASRIADLGGDDQLRVLAQACYCFNQVVKLDPTDYNARAERLRINLELGYRGRARKDCVAMLKIRQHDVGILRQLAELSRSTDDAEEALKYFTETIDHLVATDDPNNATELTWSLLNIYLELFDQPGRYGEALVKLRQVARWLLGRKDEAFWNQWDDDREWDLEDTPRRVEVGVFQLDRFGPDAYGRGLPLELRVKLGLFRLKNGLAHHSEAMQHFELLDPTDQSRTGKVFDYDDLYKDVADGLMQAGCYAEALKFYEALYDNVDSSKSSILPALANCYTFTGDLVKAEQCYKLLALTEGKYNDAVVHLARLFKASGRIREHDRLVLQLRKAGKLDLLRKYGLIGDTDGLATSDTRQAGPVTGEDVESNVENDNRLISRFGDSVRKQPFYAEKHKSLAERKEKDITDTRSIKDLLQKIAVLQVRVERGDEDALSQWLLAAELLFRDFENNSNRSVDQLYRTDLRKRKLFEEAELPSEGVDLPLPLFRDVSAEDWVDVFCRYALMLAQNNKSELCWQVFYAISESPLLNRDITLEHITHNCWIACALRLGNEDQLQNSLRWYIRKYTYTPGAYNLYTVVHGASGCRLLSQYNGGAAQKFILRQIKAIDYAVLTPQQRKLYRFSDLEISGWTRREEDGIRLPQEIIPTALATYAHMLLAGGSYTAALHYYFRCLAMIPDDPAINLAIAAAYVQHAFKRQSENRQMQIQTGLAFLHRYKAIRYRQGSTLLKQEAEFNEARFYHTIGLTHLAIPAYQRCLDMNQAVITDAKSRDGRSGYVENFSREAAYALQLIYAMNGNTALAIRISRTWLVF